MVPASAGLKDPGARAQELLPDAFLTRIRQRAAEYDRNNSFFTEDFDQLRAAGYLTMQVPSARGGAGFTLTEVARAQRRLATAAPATALAVNMHLVWVAAAMAMTERGDHGLDLVIEGAAAGEVFAFGISEGGNDSVLFDSRTAAEPDGSGGYRYTGTKIFTSLAPAWTKLGIFGKDATDPDDPRLVYGFLDRAAAGYRIADDWDPLGMRATQSRSTVLTGAHVPASQIVRDLPVGPNADPLVFGIFSSFLTLVPSVYAGIADRALALAVQAVGQRSSMKFDGQKLSMDPDIRWKIADAAMLVDSMTLQLDGLTADVSAGPGSREHGADWFRQLAGLKTRVIADARRVVDLGLQVSGGASYTASSELSRLYRDVLAGIYHPSDDESAHSTVAQAVLGPLPTGQ
ncbi:acyl-CoA dehydrogenase family protein [Saxibacter everestensis]|uniref:Acyl-CoA dehydrogenase family protein n=1 Tax=Saxibacter everestensis TaxID=2909229 RepID=A0ABY8QYI4_9MICO|nr:acyl-CoA dehydrogenase family protein [Brevibacteriaceae bacterium ZFBP1038]